MGEAQFWVGVTATVAGLIIVGYGIWYSKKAAKEIQEGNQQGYKSASNVLMGTAIGGWSNGNRWTSTWSWCRFRYEILLIKTKERYLNLFLFVLKCLL